MASSGPGPSAKASSTSSGRSQSVRRKVRLSTARCSTTAMWSSATPSTRKSGSRPPECGTPVARDAARYRMDPRDVQPAPAPAKRPPALDEKVPPPPDHQIPAGLEADLAPLRPDGQPPDDGTDPYHRDSLQAQKAFDTAVEAADRGEEEAAVRRFLTAAKLAEAAREWYLAALAFQHVG